MDFFICWKIVKASQNPNVTDKIIRVNVKYELKS